MTVSVETVTGPAIMTVMADVARLRIAVFRDWPYLYDGTLDDEHAYFTVFARAEHAVVVVARDDNEIIGAATASPLGGHSPAFLPLFQARGFDVNRVFYLGESVLLPAFRGRGLGHEFFNRREAHARGIKSAHPTTGDVAFDHAAFCAVVRASDDPRRPADYRPLDQFWGKRGYVRQDGLIGSYAWREIGSDAETDKPMQFWVRPLR